MGADEFHFQKVQDIHQELAPWQGGIARPWTYTVSHNQLEVRIEKPGLIGNVHLYCADCRSVSFADIWGSMNIVLDYRPSDPDTRFVVSDGDRFRVACNVVFLQSNVD